MADKMAQLIDTSKCTACRGCHVACKQWYDLPAVKTTNRGTYQNPPDLSAKTWTLITFQEMSEGDKVEWLFRKHQCMHCTEASCVSVCPTGAAARHFDNYVVIDQEWCIGCGYCVAACPYDAVHTLGSEEKGTARKCTFCIDRVSNGLVPACAKTCPAGAISFGTREEMLAKGQARVELLTANGSPEANLYGETQVGGLAMLYVLKKPAPVYGLPEAPHVATANVLGQWLSGIITAGVVAALPFWLLFRRKQELAAEQRSSEEGGE